MRNERTPREPCLCGDPECRRCFPRYEERDFGDRADEAYERKRQEELDRRNEDDR